MLPLPSPATAGVLALLLAASSAGSAAESPLDSGGCVALDFVGEWTLGRVYEDEILYHGGRFRDLGFGGPLDDNIELVIRTSAWGETGSVSLGSEVNKSFLTCTHCLWVGQDHSEFGTKKYMFQTFGNLVIDPNTPPGPTARSIRTWSGSAVLAEAEVMEWVNDFELVPGGECYRDLGTVHVDGFERPMLIESSFEAAQ